MLGSIEVKFWSSFLKLFWTLDVHLHNIIVLGSTTVQRVNEFDEGLTKWPSLQHHQFVVTMQVQEVAGLRFTFCTPCCSQICIHVYAIIACMMYQSALVSYCLMFSSTICSHPCLIGLPHELTGSALPAHWIRKIKLCVGQQRLSITISWNFIKLWRLIWIDMRADLVQVSSIWWHCTDWDLCWLMAWFDQLTSLRHRYSPQYAHTWL